MYLTMYILVRFTPIEPFKCYKLGLKALTFVPVNFINKNKTTLNQDAHAQTCNVVAQAFFFPHRISGIGYLDAN